MSPLLLPSVGLLYRQSLSWRSPLGLHGALGMGMGVTGMSLNKVAAEMLLADDNANFNTRCNEVEIHLPPPFFLVSQAHPPVPCLPLKMQTGIVSV